MLKTNKKMIAILLVIVLISTFIPFKVFAQISGTYTVKFTGAWTIGQVTVTSDKVGPAIVLDANDEITLTNFNPDTMRAVIEASDGFTADLSVVNGKTSISTTQAGSFPNGASLEFKVIAINNNNNGEPPQQPGSSYNVNFGTATWTINNVTVTATMAGKTINNSQSIEIEDNDVITLTNYDMDNMEVRITESGSDNPFSTSLNVDSNNGVYTTKISNRTNNGGVPNNLIFEVIDRSSQPPQGPGEEDRFDGNAYFAWLNDKDELCYHKFTNMQGSFVNEDGNIEYLMNYINANQLTDQSGNNSNFVWGQEPSGWVLASAMEDEHGNIRNDISGFYVFGDGQMDMGVQLNPCGAENGMNSMCSNGDRNFRATIYRSGYASIRFSSSESDYTYFPGFWDLVFFSSVVDVSGTSKANPAEYDTYLLEPTIRFTNDLGIGEITSVEALDINRDAVVITIVDGICTIRFNSNYYDNVVFKITAEGKEYFIKINRLVMGVSDNFAPGETDTKLFAELYYPRTKSYNDYEVVATIINKDGTSKTEVVPVSKFFSMDNVNDRLIDQYTLDGGKGLYCSQFAVKVDTQKVEGVYFTVINKGALDGENYGGTFSGSGSGSYYNLESRRIEV